MIDFCKATECIVEESNGQFTGNYWSSMYKISEETTIEIDYIGKDIQLARILYSDETMKKLHELAMKLVIAEQKISKLEKGLISNA
jgi:hypothetical protein